MRKLERPKRPRSAIKPVEDASLDGAALALAVWLGFMVLVKFLELLPSLPTAPAAQVWAIAALGG